MMERGQVTYNTPQALRQALAACASKAARGTDASSGELITRFYLDRLLARIFHANPDAWLLKGGQALLVRYPDARHVSRGGSSALGVVVGAVIPRHRLDRVGGRR
jgi:hypothetical protein